MRTAFCFDLDGTLTKQEILPLIAKEIDIEEEIKILTVLTIQGKINFESSFKLRVKLLSVIDNDKIQDIIDGVKINNNVVDFIGNNVEDCYVITNNLDCWVDKFIENKIGCKYYTSKANVNNNRVSSISNIINKGDIVEKIKSDFNYDKVVVIGDGNNDVPMFEIADVKIACGITHQPSENILKNSNIIIYSEKSLCQILKQLSYQRQV